MNLAEFYFVKLKDHNKISIKTIATAFLSNADITTMNIFLMYISYIKELHKYVMPAEFGRK